MLHPLKTTIKAIASVLIASATLFADAVVDGLFDDNQNDLEYYWYNYDDNIGMGKDDRLQSKAPGTPSEIINVGNKDSTRTDGKIVKCYIFAVGEETGNRFSKLPFRFGSTWKTSNDSLVQPFVGMGTTLCALGKSIDLAGATAVKFKIRSHVGPLTVRFKIQTLDIDKFSEIPPDSLKGDEFGYYGKSVSVTQTWSEKTVSIADLKLPGPWARNVPFDPKIATKLVWEIQKDANSAVVVDTLDIDDIMIVGCFTFFGGGGLEPIAPITDYLNFPTKNLFSNFDMQPYNESKLKTYWYAFDDRLIGGTSDIIQGAIVDSVVNQFVPEFIEGSGLDHHGNGLELSYQLGESITQNQTESKGFIGMGCNLYDSTKANYFDATSVGINSIYFQYSTDGSDGVRLEIKDINDVPDKDNPTRNTTRGSSAVWHKNFPGTNGSWKSVWIPFNSLVCDSILTGKPITPLDITKLAKMEWIVQGTEGQNCKIAIDNIYFLYFSPTDVKHTFYSTRHSFFNAQYLNGFVHIKLDKKFSFDNCKISLFKAQGSVISTISLTRPNTVTADLPAKNLPSGVYFVKIDGVAVNGKAVVLQTQVSVVR